MTTIMRSVVALVAIVIMAGCAESQLLMTPEQMAQEFVMPFPKQSKSAITSKVLKWIASNTDQYETVHVLRSTAADGIDSLISEGYMSVGPDAHAVTLKVKYTVTVEVKEHRIRIKFLNLRRWFGSKQYDIHEYDTFFSTSTGLFYQRKAQKDFNVMAERMIDFVTFAS
jgi:hypothetical protein